MYTSNMLMVTSFLFLLCLMVQSDPISNNIPKSSIKLKTEDEINLIENLRKQIKAKEDELEKAEVVNKNFEKMIQLVNILGQVDSFLTERTKMMIKKLAILADDEEENENDSKHS